MKGRREVNGALGNISSEEGKVGILCVDEAARELELIQREVGIPEGSPVRKRKIQSPT